MKACTFFGHRDCPDTIEEMLVRTIEQLILVQDVVTFYVGCQGNFDSLATTALHALKQKHPWIRCYTVLDKLPTDACKHFSLDTLYPDGLEIAPKRFAIDRRNRWMLKQSDYVLTYIKNDWGGAAKFSRIAKAHNKTVINLYNP